MAQETKDFKGERKVTKEEETKMMQEQMHLLDHRYSITLHTKLSTKAKMDLQLSKQKRILDKLHEDRKNLLSKTFVNEQDRKKEIFFLEDFVDYIREKAFLENEIKSVRDEMKELDKRNKTLEYDIKKLTTAATLKKAATTGMEVSANMTNNLENKLSQVRKCLNEVIMTCKEYRKEIDDSLGERERFRTILEGVLLKLKTGKACMLDMIEQATVSTAKREDTKLRLKKLEKDHKLSTSKQAYLFRELHSTVRVLIERAMFQSVKIQRRVMSGLEAKRKLSALVKRQDVENQIHRAKLMLQHLKHLYQVENVNEIARCYNDSDSIIMSLFNYSSNNYALGSSIHRTNDVLKYAWETTKHVSGVLIKSEYDSVQSTFYEYQNLSEEVEKLIKNLDYARTMKEFTVFRLNMMFNKGGGSVARYANLLGDHKKISADNAILMMKEVERRIVFLLGLLYMTESNLNKDKLPLKRYLLYLPSYENVEDVKLTFFGENIQTPCPVCAEAERFGLRKEAKDVIEPYDKMAADLISKSETEELQNHLHSVSHCHLPGSRRLLQQRFLKLGY